MQRCVDSLPLDSPASHVEAPNPASAAASVAPSATASPATSAAISASASASASAAASAVAGSPPPNPFATFGARVAALADACEGALQLHIGATPLPTPPSSPPVTPADLARLRREAARVEALAGGGAGGGAFEWVDGVLVRALEQGRWLVLDNANFCSPTVCLAGGRWKGARVHHDANDLLFSHAIVPAPLSGVCVLACARGFPFPSPPRCWTD